LTSPSSINFLNFSANPSASQFIWPHMLRSSYGFLSSWWAFTHLSRCQRVDSFIVSMIMVTISMLSLYCLDGSFCVGFGLPVRSLLDYQRTSHTCSWTRSDETSWSEIVVGLVPQFQIIQLVLS
jgi:hypothetical protein